MSQYIVKRLLSMIPVLFGLTVAIFLLLRVIPGDAASVMLADSPTARQKDELRSSLGLDQPLYRQYITWASGVGRGDLGTSYWTNAPVLDSIRRAAPVTIELSVLAAGLALIVGIPLGILSATKEGTLWDYGSRCVTLVALSVPHFWLGTLALILPAIWFGWVPPADYRPIWVDPMHNIAQMWMPAAVIGASASAGLGRMTRSSMLEVLGLDYIRTARAKGLRSRNVVLRHALKNAMIPVITIFGSLCAGLFGGAIIVETLFNLHGFGSLIMDAISQRDYPMIQGCVLVSGVVYSIVNLLVDLSYSLFNPRISYA